MTMQVGHISKRSCDEQSIKLQKLISRLSFNRKQISFEIHSLECLLKIFHSDSILFKTAISTLLHILYTFS